MYLIVGLGNPEPEYSKTRHNMGFDVVNQLATSHNIALVQHQFKGIYGKGIIGKEKVMIVKPQTFMNLSGVSVQKFMDYYKIEPEKLIVIYDDMDTEKGCIRIRKKGNSGSHNGMKSIVEKLGMTDFARVRVGIGRPAQEEDKINYVIGKVPQEEYSTLKKGIDKAKEAVQYMIEYGYDIARNRDNEKRKGESSEGNHNSEP